MDKLTYFRELAALGNTVQTGGPAAADLEYFATTFMRDPDRLRRLLFGANMLRRQRLTDVQRRQLRVLDAHPDLLSPINELRYEPSYTRLLAYHLDPRNAPLHTELLLNFLKWIDAGSIDRSTLPGATAVTPEHVIPGGRVDVRVELPGILVFIEAKVDSDEGVGQLATYYGALEKEKGARDGLLVYLTRPGHDPPDESIPCKHITFEDLLRLWLPIAAASDEPHGYLARFLKSTALLLGRAGVGTFDDWTFGLQRAALNLVETENG